MRKSLIFWALWLFGAFLLYFFVGTKPTLVLLILSVSVPALGVLLGFLSARKIEVFLEVPPNIQKGLPATCRIHLKNPSPIPLSRVLINVKFHNQLIDDDHILSVNLSVMPKREASAAFHLASRYCGQVVSSVERVGVFDLFGIFPFPKTAVAEGKTLILPETFVPEVNLTATSALLEDSDAYSPYQKGWDVTETFQIRDYVEGDSPKQIHWKLTQKYDQLIVRDPSLPLVRSLLIFWERTVPSAQTAPKVLDTLAEVAISLSQTLMESNIPHHIAWNHPLTGQCFVYQIEDENTLYENISRMLAASYQKGAVSGIDSYLKIMGDQEFQHVAYLSSYLPPEIMNLSGSGKTVALICSEEEIATGESENLSLYAFTPEDYREAIFSIDL